MIVAGLVFELSAEAVIARLDRRSNFEKRPDRDFTFVNRKPLLGKDKLLDLALRIHNLLHVEPSRGRKLDNGRNQVAEAGMMVVDVVAGLNFRNHGSLGGTSGVDRICRKRHVGLDDSGWALRKSTA